MAGRNLRRGGFIGELMLVYPDYDTIDGMSVPECRELARAPDLAVIARPSDTVPALIGQLGERGTRAAVVISAGFGELGEQRRCAAASGIGRGKA